MYQLRNIRSITLYPVKNRKFSFRYKLSRYWAYFEANKNLTALKSHSGSFKGHLGPFKVKLGKKKLLKFN